ncbi:MAG: DUF350 domain-containing protein, partial [Leptospiraceae bacterium]|nr:DUF350 domain-containing protein [Leptospiraceae bacterium]
MNEVFSNFFSQTAHGAVFIAIGLIVFTLAKIVKDLIEPESIDDHLTSKDNFAVAVSMVGYYFGIIIIFIAIISSPGRGFFTDIWMVVYFSIIGILLLNISHFINDKLIFPKFEMLKEIYDNRNIAAGVAVFGNYIASSLFLAVALTGEPGKENLIGFKSLNLHSDVAIILEGTILSLVFFVIGQIAQVTFVIYYSKIISYNYQLEIRNNKNIAVGISFAGAIIAIGIIVTRTLRQDFVSFAETG